VVDKLIYPVIFFIHKNALTLDFTHTLFSIYHGGTVLKTSPEIKALWNREQQAKSKCCVAAVESGDMIND